MSRISNNPISLLLSRKGFEVSGYFINGRTRQELTPFVIKKVRDDLIEFGLRAEVPSNVLAVHVTIKRIYSNIRFNEEILVTDRELRILLT